MICRMLLSLPVALVIGLSAQGDGQENKIPEHVMASALLTMGRRRTSSSALNVFK